MAKPRLILLDEPILGLSPLLVVETARLILEQNGRIPLQIASRGYLLESGHLVLEGGCKELLSSEHVKKGNLGE